MTVVLDASALLALMNDEPGALIVREALYEAVISTVNLAEVVCKLVDGGVPEAQIFNDLGEWDLSGVPLDVQQAYATGLLRAATRSFGLSLGDRACLSLALQLSSPVITTDRAWAELDLGVEVRLAR